MKVVMVTKLTIENYSIFIYAVAVCMSTDQLSPSIEVGFPELCSVEIGGTQVRQLQNKDEEIKRLKQAVIAQSEECATLKQKQSENSTALLKYETALKEYARMKTENEVLGTMVEDYKKCRENNDHLQNENNDYVNRLDEMTRTLVFVTEENRNLRAELQGFKVIYDLKDGQCRHELEKRKKLEKKLQILQGESATTIEINQPKQRFTLRKSYLPECERCKSCLFENGVVNEECKYHPQNPLPYRSWIRILPESVTDGKSSKNLYWQCCKRFSTIEPEGCTSQPRHIIRLDPIL
ncbi:hypothetical protein KUTeg_016178 [Tegillarca granosa]|uniref:Uncharacterized protein n=1 Tax=Tegillarca granosa TaxID=220873 RepID=A0ABQ9EK38_TEGGR|nr:hypothetical protein KUTeg_016178 [Tegillarca granosa]